MTEAIVPASAMLAEAMAVIHAACFGQAAWPASSIAALFESPLVFGFVDGRGGLAICRAVADEAEILTIGVAPGLRRQGRARALLALVTEEAVRRGAGVMFLEVAADNAAALDLYAACGFRRTGRRRDYYGQGCDAVLLRRMLSACQTIIDSISGV